MTSPCGLLMLEATKTSSTTYLAFTALVSEPSSAFLKTSLSCTGCDLARYQPFTVRLDPACRQCHTVTLLADSVNDVNRFDFMSDTGSISKRYHSYACIVQSNQSMLRRRSQSFIWHVPNLHSGPDMLQTTIVIIQRLLPQHSHISHWCRDQHPSG